MNIMNNNAKYRRICHIFDLTDELMIKVFSLGGLKVDRSQVCDWRKKEDDEEYAVLSDKDMGIFLNGFITLKRGKKDGPAPQPDKYMNNNIILRKLKIALNLKSEELVEVFKLGGTEITENVLSSFFRKKDHKQYKGCKDQTIRDLFRGLQAREKKEDN